MQTTNYVLQRITQPTTYSIHNIIYSIYKVNSKVIYKLQHSQLQHYTLQTTKYII